MAIIDKIQISGTTYDIGGSGGSGNNVVEVTQAEYDALVTGGTLDETALYIITDAAPADMSNYYTSAQTNSAINAAVSGKQDTLSAGTGIEISGNVISATGGGGSSYSAGTGIDITNDVISCTIPLSKGNGNYSVSLKGWEHYATDSYSVSFGGKATATCAVAFKGNLVVENEANGQSSFAQGTSTKANGNNSFAGGFFTTANGTSSHSEGNSTLAQGNYSHAEGNATSALTNNSHAEGMNTLTTNEGEHASGKYNNSNSGSTDADKTLFSVGNGTSDNARHNAFEIRQNGDIYISSGGTDIKLQDNLGGGGSFVETSAITSSITSGSTDSEIPSAKAVNDKLGGLSLVKLSQSEYNSLATKDNSTLYVIVN